VRVFYAILAQRLAGSGDLMAAGRIAGLVRMPAARSGGWGRQFGAAQVTLSSGGGRGP